jgi:hypothetical protein
MSTQPVRRRTEMADSIKTACHELTTENRNISGRVASRIVGMEELGVTERRAGKNGDILVETYHFRCTTCGDELAYDRATTCAAREKEGK